MKLDAKILLLIAAAILRADPCLSQVAPASTNSNAAATLAESHPSIPGLATNDVITALRMPDDEMLFWNKSSGQAIVKSTTNGLCFFKGGFYFAEKSRDPDQLVDIYVSQPLGTNALILDRAVTFEKQMEADFIAATSPNRRRIDLKPILQTELDTAPSEVGLPLRSARMAVEDGKLVILFESFTRIKGQVVLDAHLSPVSMSQTSKPDAP